MLSDIEFLKSFELLRDANQVGIKVTLQNDRLMVKAPKHICSDSNFLLDIKANQQIIAEFLSLTGDTSVPGNSGETELNEPDKGRFYLSGDVTPVQLYWLDERIDAEYKKLSGSHGSIVSILKLEGFIDEEILERAVTHLLQRHESLRSIFYQKDNQYFIHLLPARLDLYYKKYTFVEHSPAQTSLLDIIEFNGHYFDISAGPLFIIRFVQIDSLLP